MSTSSPILPSGNHRLALTRHHSSQASSASREAEEKDATPTPRHSHNLTERVSQNSDRLVITQTATHQQKTEPLRRVQQSAQSAPSPSSASTGFEQNWAAFFKKLNPVHAYKKAQANYRQEKQHKTEQKQQTALEQQRAKQTEADSADYYTAIQHLHSKLLKQDTPLSILPDSLQRTETERLLSAYDVDHNRFPLYERQADMTTDDKTYHVQLTEMRKADPNQRTMHPWMYPTDKAPEYCRQDISEQDPPSRYKDNTIITLQLRSSDREALEFERYPKSDPLCVTIDYTEAGGKKQHHRSFDRHFNPKDQTLLSLVQGIRSAMNQAEVKKIMTQRIPEPTEREHLQTRLDEAMTYKPSVLNQGHKLTKPQKQVLKQYQNAFLERKHTVENLITQVLIANAEQVKIKASPRRGAELPKAEEALQSRFKALADVLDTEAPQLVLPERRTISCLPHKA